MNAVCQSSLLRDWQLPKQNVHESLPADSNLTGTLPASLGNQLPDLQLLSLRNNPGEMHACFVDSTCHALLPLHR